MLEKLKHLLGVKAAAKLTPADLIEATGGSPSFAGPIVNEQTAMRTSAVFACVTLISGAVAGLPLHVYKRTRDGRERTDHPYHELLNVQASPAYSAATFWEYAMTALLLSGDAFAWIVRGEDHSVIALVPLDPRGVRVSRDTGGLAYEVTDGAGKRTKLAQADVLHIPGPGFDGLRGMSVVKIAAKESVALALAAEQSAARFFGNGAMPDFALVAPGSVSKEAAEALRAQWVARYGGVANRHTPAILSGGLEAKQLTINSADSQLLETRRFQVADIARIFGVPPHLIGETEKATSWGTGIEAMGAGFVRYTLQRHLTRIEQEVNRKLFGVRSPYFAEFSVEGLLRGDSSSRANFYRAALGGSAGPAWMTVNEVRRLENLAPEAGGDRLTTWRRETSTGTA